MMKLHTISVLLSFHLFVCTDTQVHWRRVGASGRATQADTEAL